MTGVDVRSDRGLTILEVTVVLTAAVLLIGVLAPTLSAVVRHAETTAATNAMNTIRDSILAMVNTDGLSITTTGSQVGSATKVELLVSDGDIPREVSGTGDGRWDDVTDATTGLTDFIEAHLVMNDPISSALSYSTTGGGSLWKGAYIAGPVDPDPWGNRFGVNVQYLGAGAGGTNDVVVYSAGPDEEIDSAYTANPLAATDDDLIVLVEA